MVFLKQPDDPRWELIRVVQPDVLIVTQEAYPPEELSEIKGLCGEVVVLEPQATTSTTAKIRLVLVAHIHEIKVQLDEALDRVKETLHSFLDGLTGGEGS